MIDIELTGEPTRAEFLTSPALETLFAVAVLADPAHHAFAHAWVGQVEAALTYEEQQALALIRRVPVPVAFTDILLRTGPRLTPHELASQICAEPPEVVAHGWSGEVLPLEEVREYLGRPEEGARAVLAQWPGWMNGEPDRARLVFAVPGEVRDAYATLVVRVWEIGVLPRTDLEGLWEDCLAGLRNEAAGKPPRVLATEIFSRPFARRFGPGHEFEEIYFIPSYFASPHKVVLFDQVRCIVVADCRLGSFALQQMRDDLASAWKRVADPTRLEILRLCQRERQYGQSLAAQLKLKPATIAHHLEVLRSTGLLQEQAEGAIKYQRFSVEQLEQLFMELKRYLLEEF